MRLQEIADGAFAGVFDQGDGTVVKVFRAGLQSRNPRKPGGQISFEAEVEAYEALKDHPDLEIYVPEYHGIVVLDEHAIPETDKYLLHCCIRLEFIPGQDRKISDLEDPTHTMADKKLGEIQERIGVDHPWDASCFVPGTRADFTLIDFATPAERL